MKKICQCSGAKCLIQINAEVSLRDTSAPVPSVTGAELPGHFGTIIFFDLLRLL